MLKHSRVDRRTRNNRNAIPAIVKQIFINLIKRSVVKDATVYISLRDTQKAMVEQGAAIDFPEQKKVQFIPGTYDIIVKGKTFKIKAVSKSKIEWL